MNEPTSRQRWDALTLDEQRNLKNFIVFADLAHVAELQKLGFVIQDEVDQHWMATMEGLACYTAGMDLADQRV